MLSSGSDIPKTYQTYTVSIIAKQLGFARRKSTLPPHYDTRYAVWIMSCAQRSSSISVGWRPSDS